MTKSTKDNLLFGGTWINLEQALSEISSQAPSSEIDQQRFLKRHICAGTVPTKWAGGKSLTKKQLRYFFGSKLLAKEGLAYDSNADSYKAIMILNSALASLSEATELQNTERRFFGEKYALRAMESFDERQYMTLVEAVEQIQSTTRWDATVSLSALKKEIIDGLIQLQIPDFDASRTNALRGISDAERFLSAESLREADFVLAGYGYVISIGDSRADLHLHQPILSREEVTRLWHSPSNDREDRRRAPARGRSTYKEQIHQELEKLLKTNRSLLEKGSLKDISIEVVERKLGKKLGDKGLRGRAVGNHISNFLKMHGLAPQPQRDFAREGTRKPDRT